MALLETPVAGATVEEEHVDAPPIDAIEGLRGVLLVVAVALFVVAAVTGGLVPSVAVGLLYLVGVALLSTSPGGLPGRSAFVLGAAHVAAAAVLALL